MENIEERISIIEELFQENSKLESSIETIKKSIKEQTPDEVLQQEDEDKETVKEEIIDDDLDLIGDTAEYYYIPLYEYKLQADYEKNIDEFEELLPSEECYNYDKIILRIIANFYLEIDNYRKEIESIRDDLTEEELNEFFEEINNIYKKIELINVTLEKRKYHTSTNTKVEKQKNKIIFMNKSNGQAYAYKDLTGIPVDYYDGFIELIESIEKGTFKNVKFLGNNNGKVSGITEVKDFKIRILYDRIAPHIYCIIACFMKKSNNDKDYREFCASRIATYKYKKYTIEKEILDEEYMKEQKEALRSTFELLGEDQSSSRRGGNC